MIGNVYRLFALRLGVAAAVISAGFGGLTFWYEEHLTGQEVARLAEAEALNFASFNAADLPLLMAGESRMEVEGRLEAFLLTREGSANGHFAMAELYDPSQRSLGEVARPEAEALEPLIDRTRHSFPTGREPWYDRVTVNDAVYLRIVVPMLSRGERIGFFEGVYHLSEARRAEMRGTVAWTVAAVIAVVLATTAFLVPVMIVLNRHLFKLSRQLLKANLDTLGLLGGAIAKRDSDTHYHNFRVTLYAVSLAEKLGMGSSDMQDLIKGAFLHDVGKIAIPDAILLKPGRLTAEEFEVMKTHVEHGADIIARYDWLAGADAVVRSHHEKFDGSGYPAGMAGEDIPLSARIFAIADVFDALTSRRPYKEPMPFGKAMAILREGRGSHFDPVLVDAFEEIAAPLYQAYGTDEDARVEDALEERTAQYFQM